MRIPSRFFTSSLAGLSFLIVAAAPLAAQTSPKLDRALSDVVAHSGSSELHRVIVRAKAGYRQWVRQQLATRGLSVVADHPSINGLTVELTTEAIQSLCNGGTVDG